MVLSHILVWPRSLQIDLFFNLFVLAKLHVLWAVLINLFLTIVILILFLLPDEVHQSLVVVNRS